MKIDKLFNRKIQVVFYTVSCLWILMVLSILLQNHILRRNIKEKRSGSIFEKNESSIENEFSNITDLTYETESEIRSSCSPDASLERTLLKKMRNSRIKSVETKSKTDTNKSFSASTTGEEPFSLSRNVGRNIEKIVERLKNTI